MFGKKRKLVASMMPLPPKLLAGIVAACAVAALLLLPNQETLLERQLRDEDWPKALESLRGLPAIERVERAEHYDLLEIRLRRLTLAPDDREGFTSALLPPSRPPTATNSPRASSTKSKSTPRNLFPPRRPIAS